MVEVIHGAGNPAANKVRWEGIILGGQKKELWYKVKLLGKDNFTNYALLEYDDAHGRRTITTDTVTLSYTEFVQEAEKINVEAALSIELLSKVDNVFQTLPIEIRLENKEEYDVVIDELSLKVPQGTVYQNSNKDLVLLGSTYIYRGILTPKDSETIKVNVMVQEPGEFSAKVNVRYSVLNQSFEKSAEVYEDIFVGGLKPVIKFRHDKFDINSGENDNVVFLIKNEDDEITYTGIKAAIESDFITGKYEFKAILPKQELIVESREFKMPFVQHDTEYKVLASVSYKRPDNTVIDAKEEESFMVEWQEFPVYLEILHVLPERYSIGDTIKVKVKARNIFPLLMNQIELEDSVTGLDMLSGRDFGEIDALKRGEEKIVYEYMAKVNDDASVKTKARFFDKEQLYSISKETKLEPAVKKVGEEIAEEEYERPTDKLFNKGKAREIEEEGVVKKFFLAIGRFFKRLF